MILLTILGFGIVDSRFLWTGWIPDTGGMCLVSPIYDANSNSTYSVMFAGVNFTFLYWTYPPNITDVPHKAYFLVTFDDGTEENLSLYVGGYTVIMPLQVPRGDKTSHSFPSAGVITADTWGLWRNWQYTVNLFN
ncbi:MAG: hypothetical protein IH631_03970 [Candidatus Thorarchaeota archaeon]|nr:hypothetical protein [Candidatus Thorarchaeota archaeon]